MHKYLFLDVDGVLNTTRSHSLYALSKPCLRRLALIVNDTGCDTILSSTWRKSEYAILRLARVLQYRGLHLSGYTPRLDKHGIREARLTNRGCEIEEWLLAYAAKPYNYAILDDDADMLPEQLPHFFQTDPDYGLTDAIAHRVTAHLNKE